MSTDYIALNLRQEPKDSRERQRRVKKALIWLKKYRELRKTRIINASDVRKGNVRGGGGGGGQQRCLIC